MASFRSLIRQFDPTSRCSNAEGGSFPRSRLHPAVAVGGYDVVEAEGGGGRAARSRCQQARRMVSRWCTKYIHRHLLVARELEDQL